MTVVNHGIETVSVSEATAEQGREIFEQACQRELNVSAEEFLAARESGSYPEMWDPRAIQRVEFMLPFVR